MLFITPRPPKSIIMTCSADCILGRKQELDRARIEFIYREYSDIVTHGFSRRTLFYNSELPFEESIPRSFLSDG